MRKDIFIAGAILLLILLSTVSLYGQPWMRNLPDSVTNFYTIQDEFRKYWAEREPVETRPASESEEGNGWMLFKRWEWFMAPRVHPSGQLPESGILQSRMKSFSTKLPMYAASGSNWSPMGPSVIPADGGVGRINCIAINPANTNIIWGGSASGGLWKSTDGGATWATNTDNLGTLGISSIVFNPLNPNTMYISTGDADNTDTYSIGVLKSTDAGTSWNTTGLTWTTRQYRNISLIVPHPTDTTILLAVGGQGIWRTTTGGISWTTNAVGNFKDLAVDPSNPTIWYTARNAVGVYKSTNSGFTFSKDTTGLPTTGFGRIAIAIAPSLPSTLYALYVNEAEGFYGLYKSTNSGGNWTLQSSSPNILSWDGTGTDGQGWYDLVLEVDPNSPSTVYVGGINLYRSTTGGTSWTKLTHWYEGTGRPYIHADQHGFAFFPGSSTTFFAGNDGGIFRSTNAGSTWSDLSTGLTVTQFYRLGCSATNPDRIYAGSQDNGSSRYLNGSWQQIYGGDGMEALIDYSDENIGYCELYYGSIFRTTDGGASMVPISGTISEGGAWVTPYVINPLNPKSIYVLKTGLYKSTNRGDTWTTLSSNLSSSPMTVLTIAPSDSNTIYAGDYSMLLVSTNGGTSWTNITASLPAAAITYVAVDPSNPSTAYVTFSGYANQKVYKTTNRGSSWTNISTGLPAIPVNTIVVNPTNDDLYVGTDVGVYQSTNDGASWSSFSDGLPNVVIDELEIQMSAWKLRAATYGRGLWETPISFQHGSIAGTLFEDMNGDGIKDADEPTLQNWKIRLSGVQIDSAITDADGNYIFNNLLAGDYAVSEDIPAGWHVLLPVSGTHSITLTGSSNIIDKNFANYRFGSFSGIIFNDVNYNGVRDGGDSGLAGWTIRVLGPPTISMTNDSTGNYTFQDLIPGPSTVSESTIVGWFQTMPPTRGSYTVSIRSGLNTAGIDFGNYYSPILSVAVANGWNMVSLPLRAEDYHKTVLFPTAVSSVYAYEGTYTEKDILSNGIGYWIKFSGGQTVEHRGYPWLADTIDVSDGWNLMGSLSEPIAVTDVSSSPPGIITSQFFGYGQKYIASDSIISGKGYWVKVNGSGKLILAHAAENGLSAGQIKIVPTSELPPAPPDGDATPVSVPATFKLVQAYPNPFNPNTSISYQLPTQSYITLKIFDVLGKEVATLVNDIEEAGYKSIVFNANGLPSGVYYYRLQAGNYIETKKLLLLR